LKFKTDRNVASCKDLNSSRYFEDKTVTLRIGQLKAGIK